MISIYRTVVGVAGVSVPATRMAKYKTLCQQLAVGFALLPWTALAATWLWKGFLWLAVVLAVWSGWHYLRSAARPSPRRPMRCDVLAIGTELLLGQIVDTNSSWIGEQLAAHGIASLTQVKIGDNVGRIEAALRRLLADADAVIVCGGLGPTHDDVTRDAIAAVMGAELRPGRHRRRRHPRAVRVPRSGDAREQPAPGARAGGCDGDPPDPGHGAGADLPGRRW